jgi:two-component system nitrogen regulation response regulator GlnG
LFHRLNVIRLRLPALRERREDVPMLTRHFLQQSAAQLGVEPKRISDAALVWLSNFSYPGNVRQLENICHWLTVMAPAQVVEPKDLPPEVGVYANATGEFQLPEHEPVPRALAASPSAMMPAAAPVTQTSAAAAAGLPPLTGEGWELGLEADAIALLASDRHDVWDELSRRFESRLILTALAATRGRRIEAAQRLGIGRNTITRKIQELGLE